MHQLGGVVEEHESFADMDLSLTRATQIHDAAGGFKCRKRLLLDLFGNVFLREIREVVAHVREGAGNALRYETHLLGILGHHLDHFEDVRVTEPTNDPSRRGQTWSAS